MPASTAATGSVLFSTNGGDTWQTMHDFGHVVTWVEVDPTNPNRLYAAVAHSTDGGIYVTNNAQAGAASTWTKLATPPRTEGHAFNIRVLTDGTLVVSYSGRRDAGGAFTASSGVFVSTNGGQSWQDRSHTGMRYWTKDVVIDPHDPTQNTWYASVFSGWGGPPNGLGGLYRTTDRGQHWTRINALDRVNSITVSPTNPNEAYLTTEIEGLVVHRESARREPDVHAGGRLQVHAADARRLQPVRSQRSVGHELRRRFARGHDLRWITGRPPRYARVRRRGRERLDGRVSQPIGEPESQQHERIRRAHRRGPGRGTTMERDQQDRHPVRHGR